MKKIISIFSVIIFSLFLCAENSFGQKIEIKITINGNPAKANNLVTPEYPPAAIAVRSQGEVEVKITVDEEGNVTSAKAVSGHTLLREASVKAAKESSFAPTQIDGQPVKASGSLIYNFTLPDEQDE